MLLEQTNGDSSAAIEHSSTTRGRKDTSTEVSIMIRGELSHESFKDPGRAAKYYRDMCRLVRAGVLRTNHSLPLC